MSDNQKVNADEFVRGLNGFDDIAIEKAFGKPLVEMSEMRAPRALLFIMYRREGQSDFDAYKNAMEVMYGGLTDIFETSEDEEPEENVAAALDGRGN